jgi:hypothetical protein
MTFSDLVRQVYESKSRGVDLAAGEVGPKTWMFLLDTTEAGTGKKWPEGFKESAKEGNFMGISIRPANVPEGKVWPLEGVR